MKNLKWPFITSVSVSIGILIYLLLNQSLTIETLSDTFFIASLFFLIIGIALWIMSSEFFDNFQRFMYMHTRRRKQNTPKEIVPLSEIGHAHQRYWLETGVILLIVSLISLLFYFF